MDPTVNYSGSTYRTEVRFASFLSGGFITVIQGVSWQTFIFHFAMAGRNMKASFGLKAIWES